MKSRSWLLILVMGILGMGALGFLTKFALDSSPGLRRMVKLKEALASELSPRGAEEVSVKSLPRNGGFEIRIDVARARAGEPEAFVTQVAEKFIAGYTGPPPGLLKISLAEPGSFGCAGPQTYFAKSLAVAAVRSRMELRSALERLRQGLASAGMTLDACEPQEPVRLRVEVPEPQDEAAVDRHLEIVRSLAREHLSAGVGREVQIALWASGTLPGKERARLLKEEKVERTAGIRKKPTIPSRTSGGKTSGR